MWNMHHKPWDNHHKPSYNHHKPWDLEVISQMFHHVSGGQAYPVSSGGHQERRKSTIDCAEPRARRLVITSSRKVPYQWNFSWKCIPIMGGCPLPLLKTFDSYRRLLPTKKSRSSNPDNVRYHEGLGYVHQTHELLPNHLHSYYIIFWIPSNQIIYNNHKDR